MGRAAILSAILCSVLIGCGGKPAEQAKVPQEEINRPNPVPMNSDAVEDGKRLYGATDCALCHGKDGDGRGLEAKDVNMNTHDWRKPENLQRFTDGELAYLILKGKGRMPAYDGRESPDQVWRLVNYIRSFAVIGKQ
jgi:mono/diheme cytochrome c family protein